MLSYKESLKILKEANALIEGHFILSSGLHSPQYVQCAQLMSKPNHAFKICTSLASKIQKEFNDFDLILSPAMGGILVGYEIGKLLKKESIFSERVNGEFKLRRDFFIFLFNFFCQRVANLYSKTWLTHELSTLNIFWTM